MTDNRDFFLSSFQNYLGNIIKYFSFDYQNMDIKLPLKQILNLWVPSDTAFFLPKNLFFTTTLMANYSTCCGKIWFNI